MTKTEIIELARESGGVDISSRGWTSWVGTQSTEFLERFANLVAAAEREACAKVCENLAMQQDRDVRDECAAAIRARWKHD